MKQDTIFSAMESSVDISMQKFNEACDETINCSYVIASGKINKLLIAIASSKPLFKLFNALTNGYNFILDFENCKFRDEKGTPYLQPPTDAKEQVCFTFCLLYAIDTGKLELKNLLSSFYKHINGANYEYGSFCEDIIIPFQKNVNDFIQNQLSLAMQNAESAATN